MELCNASATKLTDGRTMRVICLGFDSGSAHAEDFYYFAPVVQMGERLWFGLVSDGSVFAEHIRLGRAISVFSDGLAGSACLAKVRELGHADRVSFVKYGRAVTELLSRLAFGLNNLVAIEIEASHSNAGSIRDPANICLRT